MNLYKNPNPIFFLVGILALLSSCDTIVDVELPESTPTFTVDAFINDKPETQQITINYSQAYFDNSAFDAASNASVVVQNTTTGKSFTFEESESEQGVYEWTPSIGQLLGNAEDEFTLKIDYLGEQFEAFSKMGRVPEIDSINFTMEEGTFGEDDFYSATFFAEDFEGAGDTYWIKAYKNGEWLNEPDLINIAYDAGESRGGQNDGGIFEFDLRNNINPLNEEDRYEFGDEVRVEIHSITEETFFFFTEMREVVNRPGGFAELFAEPLSNVATNIKSTGDNNTNALGFFCVSSVSEMTKVFGPELITDTNR